MKQETIDKRNRLKELSKIAAQYIEMEQAGSINEGLAIMYAGDGHTELHSFNQWRKQGFAVRKGEKALLMWGEPKKVARQEQPATPGQKQDDEYKYWPMAYLFSQKQVHKIEEHAEAL